MFHKLNNLTILSDPGRFKLMSLKFSSEQGSAAILAIFGLVAVALFVSGTVPVSKNYSKGQGVVAGASVEKGKPQPAAAVKAEVRTATEAGETAVVSGTAGAVSKFPLKIDPETNTLTVTTPAGTKVVAVLPDQAIKNMLASKVMSYVTSVPTKSSLASINSLVKMEEKDGVLGYEVEGKKEHRLFGKTFWKTNVTTFVSAETGQVVKTEQSFLGRIFNRLLP